MKKYLFAVLAALSLVFAPAAGAEGSVDEYLYDMSAAGFRVDDPHMVLSLGMAVCLDMYNGATMRDEIEQAVELGMDARSANQFVRIAVADLCPAAASGSNA